MSASSYVSLVVAFQYWLQPAATLSAAVLVLISASLTIRQRHRADSKDQWWTRTQWGMELNLTRDDPARREAGLLVIDHQARSRFADAEDNDLIKALGLAVVADIVDTGENRDPGGD